MINNEKLQGKLLTVIFMFLVSGVSPLQVHAAGLSRRIVGS
jgi:hypothetical protein